MDKLLGSFAKEYIDKLEIKDLVDLEILLSFDDNSLYNFYRGLKTEVLFKENKINILFKNFKLKN